MQKEESVVLELLKYDIKDVKLDFFSSDINWITVLGYLTYHRVAGLVYEKIKFLGARNFEYAIYLNTYMINYGQCKRAIIQNKWINIISTELNTQNIEHAFLKGSILNNTLFNYGARVSNDIDILVKKDSLHAITRVLNKLGFVQGKYNYETKKIIKFTKNEVECSIVTRGETAPFVMKCNSDIIETIDIDINFSIDWNPNNCEIVDYFLSNRILIDKYDNKKIYSLNYYHNFIELCVHFYKDAFLIDILKKRKILDLYKFVDIYYYIKKFFDKIDIDVLFDEIAKYGLQKNIYSTLRYVIEIFPDSNIDKIKNLMKKIKDNDNNEIIFDQANSKIKMYTTTGILERVFSYDIIKKYRRIIDE